MGEFDIKEELEEVKDIKDGKGAWAWVKRKVGEIYASAQKHPKTAFIVGGVLGFVVGFIVG